jgi:uroporphyrin-3 C-methyltransferase
MIALVALGCALYVIITNTKHHQGSSQDLSLLKAKLNSLTSEQKYKERLQKETFKTLTKTQNELQTQLTSLHQQLQTALQQRLYQSKDWLLLKVRYFLELAEINAHWTDNSEATIALLQQADALLAEVHDSRFFTVRQLIKKEMVQLQALPSLDITGLLSQLDAAQSAVLKLPLKPTVTAVKNPSSTNPSSTWQARLKESMNLLGQLVVVRRHDGDILPLPSEAYELMLREKVQLNLQETQWAVLQHDEALYQFSLTQAIKTTKDSFDLDKPETKAIIEQLTQLQQVHLTKQKPMLGQSLPLLNQLIESKVIQIPTSAGENS